MVDSEVTGRMPGRTGVSTPRARRSAIRLSYSEASKKNWVTPKSASSSLAARWSRSLGQVRRAGVAGRVGRHADGEAADGPGQLDQLRGVGQLAGPGVGVLGRVTAERHQVLDPALRSETRMSASSRRVWATQMRWAIGLRLVVCSMPDTRSNVR